VWEWQEVATAALGGTIQRRVLVIEDDDAVRTMLLTVLEVADYEVLGVRSGDEALTVLGRWCPDVIMLGLPGADRSGFQFLDERARRVDVAEIPVVVVTFSSVALPPAGQLGVRAVLQQPHDVGYLRMLVAEAILDPKGSVGRGEPRH
jgi:CheY-like chemotaxis protein